MGIAAQLVSERLRAVTKRRLKALEDERAHETPWGVPVDLARFIAKYQPAHREIPHHLAGLVRVLEEAALAGGARVLVSMPPRHGKSVTTLAALAWCVARQPSRLNAYVSYAQRFANGQSRKVRRLDLAAGIVLADDAAAVHDWRTIPGGGLIATGIGGPLTGIGINGLMVVDDPVKGREQAESPVQREAVWDWFTDVAYTRLEPGSSCVVVATRWHGDDLIGRLTASEQGWQVINLPAVRTSETNWTPADEGVALWPERFGLGTLRRIRAQIGEYAWASLYQGHPVPRGGTLFRAPTYYDEPVTNGARLWIAVDPAGSASTRADYTAAVVLAVREERVEGEREPRICADVLEVLRLQLETDKAAAELEALQARHGHAKLYLEASRDGKAIGKVLAKINPRLRLAEVSAIGDKFTRAQPLLAAWNQGRVRVPRAAKWLQDFLYETERFTGVNDKHDDQVDALAHCWNVATVTPRTVRESHYDA